MRARLPGGSGGKSDFTAQAEKREGEGAQAAEALSLSPHCKSFPSLFPALHSKPHNMLLPARILGHESLEHSFSHRRRGRRPWRTKAPIEIFAAKGVDHGGSL